MCFFFFSRFRFFNTFTFLSVFHLADKLTYFPFRQAPVFLLNIVIIIAWALGLAVGPE